MFPMLTEMAENIAYPPNEQNATNIFELLAISDSSRRDQFIRCFKTLYKADEVDIYKSYSYLLTTVRIHSRKTKFRTVMYGPNRESYYKDISIEDNDWKCGSHSCYSESVKRKQICRPAVVKSGIGIEGYKTSFFTTCGMCH